MMIVTSDYVEKITSNDCKLNTLQMIVDNEIPTMLLTRFDILHFERC
jgi:hypothetical protein